MIVQKMLKLNLNSTQQDILSEQPSCTPVRCAVAHRLKGEVGKFLTANSHPDFRDINPATTRKPIHQPTGADKQMLFIMARLFSRFSYPPEGIF